MSARLTPFGGTVGSTVAIIFSAVDCYYKLMTIAAAISIRPIILLFVPLMIEGCIFYFLLLL